MNHGYEVLGDTTILSEDALIEELVVDNHTRRWTPEKRLMGAVLADAILESVRGKLSAQNWVRSCRRDYLFSFEHVCETLGMDPGERRRQITAMWREPLLRQVHRVTGRNHKVGGAGKRARAEF